NGTATTDRQAEQDKSYCETCGRNLGLDDLDNRRLGCLHRIELGTTISISAGQPLLLLLQSNAWLVPFETACASFRLQPTNSPPKWAGPAPALLTSLRNLAPMIITVRVSSSFGTRHCKHSRHLTETSRRRTLCASSSEAQLAGPSRRIARG